MTTQAERTQLGFSIEGLLGSYADPTDLGYHVRNAVEQDLAVLNLGVVIARPVAEEHALLRTEYKFEREGTQDRNGRIRMRTTRERLEITNRGAVTAEGVGIELQAVGDGEPPHLHSVDIKPDIIPQSHCDFPVLMSLSTGGAFKVALTWREGEEQHAETQILIG